MDHGYFLDRISAWLDSDLPPYEAQVVGEHLETCQECQELLARLKQVDTLVDQHSQLNGGENYWEGMARKIEAQLGRPEEEVVTDIRPKKSSGLVWKLTAAAASVAILTFIGIHQADIFKQKETAAPATLMMPVDTSSKQEGLTDQSAEVARDEEIAGRDAASEPTRAEEPIISEPKRADDKDAETPAPPVAAPPVEWKKKIIQEPKAEDSPVETDQNEAAGREQLIPPAPQHKVAETAQQTISKEKSDEVVVGKAQADSPFKTAPAASDRQTFIDSLNQTVDSYATRLPESLSGAVQSSQADRVMRPSLSLNTDGSKSLSPETPTIDLAGWIARRDSLETLWADLESEHGRLAIVKGRKEKSVADASMVERQLLEAQYNVGLLTRDSDNAAFDNSTRFLQTYLQRPDAQYRQAAQEYLDRLAPDSLDKR